MGGTDHEREPLTALEAVLVVILYASSGVVAAAYLLAAWHWFFS